MIKYKNLNNISEQLEKEIPKLEKGQEIVFQMLNGHPNNDMDRNEREKNPVLYGKTQLQTKFRIKDPFSKNNVDVGLPMEVDNDIVKSYKPFLAGMDEGVFKGKFSLIGGNMQHEELYEIFWLSPEREGSPCSDSAVKPVFKILNHKEESQKTISKVDTLRKAINDLDKLKDEDYIQVAASQNWPDTDIDSIKAKVSELAKSDPEKYNKIRSDKNTEVRSNIKKALDKGVVSYDPISGVVKTGDSAMFTVTKDGKIDYLGAIADWVNTSKNGKDVYDGILKQLG